LIHSQISFQGQREVIFHHWIFWKRSRKKRKNISRKACHKKYGISFDVFRLNFFYELERKKSILKERWWIFGLEETSPFIPVFTRLFRFFFVRKKVLYFCFFFFTLSSPKKIWLENIQTSNLLNQQKDLVLFSAWRILFLLLSVFFLFFPKIKALSLLFTDSKKIFRFVEMRKILCKSLLPSSRNKE